jgi:hypothetical protein
LGGSRYLYSSWHPFDLGSPNPQLNRNPKRPPGVGQNCSFSVVFAVSNSEQDSKPGQTNIERRQSET